MQWISIPKVCYEMGCKFEIQRDGVNMGFLVKHDDFVFFAADQVTEKGTRKDLSSINAVIEVLHQTQNRSDAVLASSVTVKPKPANQVAS